MVKKAVLIFLVIFFFSVSVSNAEYPDWTKKNGWIEWEEFCDFVYEGKRIDCSEGPLVTEKSFFSHWAGEALEVYFNTSIKDVMNYNSPFG